MLIKKAGMAVLISDKMDFRAKNYWTQRGMLHIDDSINPPGRHSNLTVYLLNNRASICMKQNLIEL